MRTTGPVLRHFLGSFDRFRVSNPTAYSMGQLGSHVKARLIDGFEDRGKLAGTGRRKRLCQDFLHVDVLGRLSSGQVDETLHLVDRKNFERAGWNSYRRSGYVVHSNADHSDVEHLYVQKDTCRKSR